MASFYRSDQMNRLKKVQSYDHSNHQGTAWDAYTADDRYQMQLSYDMNGNILTLHRNGNNSNNLVMDNFNYKYYSLSSGTPQNIQLTGFNGNNTNIATNRLSLLEEDISLAANYNTDVDGLSGTGNVNYSYDALGNLTQDLSEEIQEIKWNAYGKVVEVTRTTNNHNKPDLAYVYDAFGQRIKKIVKKRTAGVLSNEKDWQETYYVHDAQGNVMAMYNHTSAFFPNNNNYVSESFSISEWNLYGSSRLGARNIDKVADVVFLASRNYNWVNSTVTNEYIAPTANFTYKKYRVLGVKTFELTNHLGNVIATISDRKLMVQDSQTPGFVHHYKPEILSIGEQYAFGMSMPGRTFSVENYRYGFNGKENQDELLGEDNAQDFGARMYDARVGRWWGLDPNQNSYAHLSPYNGMENNPIYFNDPDGKDATITIVGNSMIISTKIYITGITATVELADQIRAQILADWNKGWKYKGYNVKFNVDVVVYNGGEREPNSNSITITDAPRLLYDGYRSFVNGNTGNWHSQLNDKAQKYHWSHEFGHLIGIMDGYIEQEVPNKVQGAEPTLQTYICEGYGSNNIMSNDDGIVEQKNIDWLGDYAIKNMKFKNDPFLKSRTIIINNKNGSFIGPKLTKNDNKAKRYERKTINKPSPKRGGSQKSQKKNGNGGQTRYKNPRFL